MASRFGPQDNSSGNGNMTDTTLTPQFTGTGPSGGGAPLFASRIGSSGKWTRVRSDLREPAVPGTVHAQVPCAIPAGLESVEFGGEEG